MSDSGINILVLGKSGVGKSSFCNYIFGEDVFLTGKGKPVTGWSDHFKHYTVDYKSYQLNVYDTVGIETDNYTKWKATLDQFLNERSRHSSKDPLQWIHGVFYLINAASARIENIEIELIKGICSEHDVPLIVVLTNADVASEAQINSIKSELEHISTQNAIDFEVTEVCSVSIRTRAGVKESFGKEETLNILLTSLDEKLRGSILKYCADFYIFSLEGLRKKLKSKVDESNVGLISLIKSANVDEKNEDVFNFDVDSVERSVAEMLESIERLNSFIDQFDFAQDSETRQKLANMLEDMGDTLEEGSKKLEVYLDSAQEDLSEGGFLDQVSAFYKVIKIATNAKGFFKKAIDKAIDPTIAKLSEYKKEI
ncbi:GTPase [uncultured Psychrobacter sp.]|uniref:GTPase domain-containing protein n=1 Tax=uncultured Psychrobacter sp. TaxID=259303 RepID=UPI002595B547|nr:GTPase [uncultured Psychrobacter sp.]